MATHQARRFAELLIVSATVQSLLGAGYLIDVNDGEDDVLLGCADHDQILRVMFSTDEDVLFVVRDGARRGWVRFIYGNSGFDVMNDCTSNLEAVLQPANDLANMIEGDPVAMLDWAVNHSSIAKDAARYRWLRDQHDRGDSSIVVMDDGQLIEDLAGIPAGIGNEPPLNLDAAIDILMAKSTQSCALHS